MKKVLLIAVLFCVANSLWSNGGPVDWSTVIGAGNPQLINIPSVTLHKEKLSLEIKEGYIKVDVEYTLERTDWIESDEVMYGFPVDFGNNYDYGVGYQWDERNIKDMQFTLNGKVIPYKSQEDIGIYVKQIEDSETGGYQERSTKRKWFYTTFKLTRDEVVTLRITYMILPMYEDSATSKSFFTYFSERSLSWDFTPASYWGDGKVYEFEVSLSANKNVVDEGSLTISGLPLKLKDGLYTYKAESFDLSNANPLYIKYTQNDILAKMDIDKSNIISSNHLVGVKTSSSQQKYPAKQLYDNNLSTAWCPERSGIGEWVEIETQPFYLSALILFGGYTKSAETYYNNNRVKKIRLETWRIDEEMNRSKVSDSIDIDLEDIPFTQPININSFEVFDNGDGASQVWKLKITILEVYKGRKYDDTCISGLYTLGYIPDRGE